MKLTEYMDKMVDIALGLGLVQVSWQPGRVWSSDRSQHNDVKGIAMQGGVMWLLRAADTLLPLSLFAKAGTLPERRSRDGGVYVRFCANMSGTIDVSTHAVWKDGSTEFAGGIHKFRDELDMLATVMNRLSDMPKSLEPVSLFDLEVFFNSLSFRRDIVDGVERITRVKSTYT